jgi:hypothetical protein
VPVRFAPLLTAERGARAFLNEGTLKIKPDWLGCALKKGIRESLPIRTYSPISIFQ